MARIHTLEDDITFERVRSLPRRTRVCSVHRQLSWACQKEIQLYEKDSRVTTNNLKRSKTALQSRYRELAKVQTSINQNKSEAYKRRASCPAVLQQRRGSNEVNSEIVMKPSIATNSKGHESEDKMVANRSNTDHRLKPLPRSISMYEKLITEKDGSNAELLKRPIVQFKRQQTVSN